MQTGTENPGRGSGAERPAVKVTIHSPDGCGKGGRDESGIKRLRMPWKNCITVGRAYDLVRDDLLRHLAYLQEEIGYRYCRFHALFHDDMAVVKRDPDGRLRFHWHHVDKVFDSLLDLGLRPFVEINPMPAVLASGTQRMFHYRMNVTPPADYGEWAQLIRAFISRCIERYGSSEVRQWYFEVWNEPNLPGFWSGTKEEYFKLYDSTVREIKAADPACRVGGPATARGEWIEEIIDHCIQNDVPLDFVSTHIYPMDEPLIYGSVAESPYPRGGFFAAKIREVYEIVQKSPMPQLEIHWTEWNAQHAATEKEVTFSDNRYMDSLYAAAFIAWNMIELDRFCDSLAYWAASDIFEEHPIPAAPFSCSYGLVSIHGIPKASCNAFRLLSLLDGETLAVDVEDEKSGRGPGAELRNGCGAYAVLNGNCIRLLCCNHRFIGEQGQRPRYFTIFAPDLPQGEYLLSIHTVSAGGGSPREVWEAAGKPENISPLQLEVLRAKAEPGRELVRFTSRSAEEPVISLSLESGAVALIEICPAAREALPKSKISGLNVLELKLGEDTQP